MSAPGEAVQRDQRQHLVRQVGRERRGLAGRVVGGDDLDDVEADELDPGEAADDGEHVVRRWAAGLRGAGARRVGRIDDIDVERQEGRSIADPLQDAGRRRPPARASNTSSVVT